MVKFILLMMLLLCSCPLPAQEPTITWGPKITHTSRNLNHLQVIGKGTGNTFYTCYTQGRQVTLERYNAQNQRTWMVAIAPRSPDGNPADFEDIVLLHQQVYLISSVREKYKKTVFAQQIDASGNYLPTIHQLATTVPDADVLLKTQNNRLLLVLQQQADPQHTSVYLYFGSLNPIWTQTLPVKGNISEVYISDTGTSFILTELPPTNSPESAFYVYRFEGRNGKSNTQAIGSTAHRPLQAKMAAFNGDVVVAGITSPAPFVASLNPEPTGLFYYRFPRGRFRKHILNYSPIDSAFLHNYKLYKPDQDHSQRLRYLQLQYLLPLSNNRTALLGEVYTLADRQKHFDDILITAFKPNGQPLYITSANKHQTEQINTAQLGSYIATTVQDTIKLLYLDFEYNYNERNEIIMASPRAVLKTPVVATIYPDSTQKVRPLRNTQTGRHQDFYLMPASAYKVSKDEFIVLGAGNGYYRFGRLKF